MEEIYLITGVTGFLGYMVAKKLLEQGKKVVGLRLPGGSREGLCAEEFC